MLTGLVIVTSMITLQDNLGAYLGIESNEIVDGATLVLTMFGQIPFGNIVLICGIVLFAYSTTIGWQYYGNRCITYLTGGKGLTFYKLVYLASCFVGAIGIGDFL